MTRKMELPVTLLIELKDGWTTRTGPAPGDLAIISDGQVQAFDYATVRARLQDILADVTKHDETIGWRVTAVNEA